MNDDYDALRQLLASRAFLHARQNGPLYDRRGCQIPWIYYGGEVSLTSVGLRLMGSVLVERLSTFASTQIATYGVSAIQILTACILQGAGKYSGLVIRKERKNYGAGRKIDGPIDRVRSVVLIDESISSGTSAYEAICALEAEGLKVEGVLCAIEFRGYGAAEWLRGRGYRVETVFDVWSDLGQAREPSKAVQALPDAMWSTTDHCPAGLVPANLARFVAATFARTGLLPQVPANLDRDYDAHGGTFVSIRRRADDNRLVRAGLRHVESESVHVPQDVVLATYRALAEAPAGSLHDLGTLKFSVSFLSAREPIRARHINHERHALIVRGVGPLDRMGFALPNTPHYDDEIQQYRYARTISTNFWRLEPHGLYQQRVERSIEPGCTWPPYGAPRPDNEWFDSAIMAEAVADRIRRILKDVAGEPSTGKALAPLQCDEPIYGVAVSIYVDSLEGCAISWASDFATALQRATVAALHDNRYGSRARSYSSDQLSVVVSLLLRRRCLGQMIAERLALFYRLGRDTLQASAEGSSGLVLAHFAVHQSLTFEQYQDQVLQKAGLREENAQWTAYETASWLVAAGRTRRYERGFPVQNGFDKARPLELLDEIATFVLRQRAEDGLPAYLFHPWSGSTTTTGTATRILIALTGLIEAGGILGRDLVEQAEKMLNLFIAGERVRVPRADLAWDNASDSQLLICLSSLSERHRYCALGGRLVSNLRRLVREDGAIYAGRARMEADLDFLSGSVLFALARASEWIPGVFADVDLPKIVAFYQQRFRLSHPWGMVWWHGQAWSALGHFQTGFSQFAFELVDWALERQSDFSGGFIIHDLEPQRQSFLTACVLEGVADVWALSKQKGDSERAKVYARSWLRGIELVDRLTIHRDDIFFSTYAKDAVGGVRPTLVSAELRIDYAGHALLALAKGLRIASECESCGADH
jgi:orotate phosphoribosyltransferase/AMMECR1 domain-containing protein